jgi:protein-S-isoprenylcysteine O-methyltransferase Ste14
LSAAAIYRGLLTDLWIVWVAYWVVSAVGVKRVQRRESAASRASHVVPLMIAVWLLTVQPLSWPVLSWRPFPATLPTYLVGLVIAFIGLLFSVWARMHLGRNWSASVTVKQGHELVRTGPYGLVRHPIYTGLLAGLLGTAIARNDAQAFVALAIALVALWHKLHVEERFMEETFGDAYRDYRASVKALIPFVL